MTNPLLETWGGIGLPPFDRIKPEHFRPAFDEVMARQKQAIEAVASAKEPPTFDNTIVAIEKSGLVVTDVEVLRLHYAETLKEWRRRFNGHRAEIAKLYDERFCRMWEFYLAGAEMAFRHGGQAVELEQCFQGRADRGLVVDDEHLQHDRGSIMTHDWPRGVGCRRRAEPGD